MPSASWRLWSPSRPRPAMWTAPRRRSRCALRCCRPRPRSRRVPCSTPGNPPDLIARIGGTGAGKLLLLGHLDTVVAHHAHRPLSRDGERLYGPGTVDMKGGVVLALGLVRALSARSETFEELSVLLVTDEEWRSTPFAHVERFAGYDACLCFEAGERTAHRGGGRRRQAQGGWNAAGRCDRSCRSLRERAGPGPQRAPGAGPAGAAAGRPARSERTGPIERRADRRSFRGRAECRSGGG